MCGAVEAGMFWQDFDNFHQNAVCLVCLEHLKNTHFARGGTVPACISIMETGVYLPVLKSDSSVLYKWGSF